MKIIKAIKNLGFIIKEAKRDNTDPSRKLIVCPVCNKPSLKKMPSSISGWLTAPMYFCTREECNYSGYLYAEIVVEEENDPFKEFDLMEDESKNARKEHSPVNGEVVERSD